MAVATIFIRKRAGSQRERRTIRFAEIAAFDRERHEAKAVDDLLSGGHGWSGCSVRIAECSPASIPTTVPHNHERRSYYLRIGVIRRHNPSWFKTLRNRLLNTCRANSIDES